MHLIIESKIIKDTCPYSLKVLSFLGEIEKNNFVEVMVCDENFQNKNSQQLGKIGGKLQVPCLNIDDNWYYESTDIIGILNKKFNVYNKKTPITDYISITFEKVIGLKKQCK